MKAAEDIIFGLGFYPSKRGTQEGREIVKAMNIYADQFKVSDEWEDAETTVPDDWTQVVACVEDEEGMYSLAAIYNGKVFLDMEDKEGLSDVLFWKYLPVKKTKDK